MTRSELVERLAIAHPQLGHSDVESIVDVIFDAIAAGLARGERVELRGFGSFSVRRREARRGRNPRTDGSVDVAEQHVPHFKMGKEMFGRLNSPVSTSLA